MRKNQGFTLIELLVVIGVIGILGAISLPAYNDYVTRGKLAEATSALADGRIKMEQFFQDNRSYTSGTLTVGTLCPSTLGWGSATTYFTYTCSNLTTTTYTLTATGGTGVSGWTYTIDQSNIKKTTAAPTAWQPTGGVPQSCWVIKKKSC